ncbi:MAG: glutamine--fructose-6-phosphate transaminase (isomerizing) [Clostridia bacterium]|nr:glutamine--fructose-6-phosphate transaminase (isomerizing) [Clostridia bacterium]
MCGIVGYIGTRKASPILIDGLLKLEYRGYDSAGISTIENGYISNMKDKGRVKNLYEIPGIDDLTGTIGIAHTRWATHGKPAKENSHPHMDNSNLFSVVHNGIIENYQELKEFLIGNGYHFISQTDTEIIPNLIHYYYTKNAQNENRLLHAIHLACKDLKGSYAIEVLCMDEPNTMIVARKDSPLVIGVGENENYISSDIPAILSYTKSFYLLNDGDLAKLSKDSVSFYDMDLTPIKKEVKNIEWDVSACEKDGYEDFMLKEIYEQPKSVRETIGSRLKKNEKVNFDDIGFTKETLSNFNMIYMVACGTAMHAGLAVKPMLEKLCHIPVTVDIASEFRYREPLIDEHTLCIYISQSGETADTIAALKLSKAKGATTLAISNVIGSSITREADYTIYTHAGPEIAVASTKAYTSQITLLTLLTLYFAEVLESVSADTIDNIKSELLLLPEKISEALKNVEKVKNFAHKVYTEKDIFFLGRGTDYTVAMEASLKLKEISYIHSEAYASGELKHGPIALIENGITVVGILTDPNLVEKSVSNLQEVITRGAKTLVVTNQEINKENYDEVIEIPSTHPLISPIISIIPLQLFSYYISKEKGLDVDKPRNLAKSVTVE